MPQSAAPGITHVVLDFDGTCTQIPPVHETYLELYRKGLDDAVGVSPAQWEDAQRAVRQHSPRAAWTIAGCAAAPAAADPYILADESAKYIARQRGLPPGRIPPDLNAAPYASAVAPWRPDARDTLLRLVEAGVTVAFVSNSSTKFIQGRLGELFGGDQTMLSRVSVFSDAGKFRICEVPWDAPHAASDEAKARFTRLPAAAQQLPQECQRPIYLRRGQYLQAIDRVLAGRWENLATAVFCGDIWEMDLAMPSALGANVHLLARAAPFETYAYEKEALAATGGRGKSSEDLSGLLDWL